MLPIELHSLRTVSSRDESETILRRELIRTGASQDVFAFFLEMLETGGAVVAISWTGAVVVHLDDEESESWWTIIPGGIRRLH